MKYLLVRPEAIACGADLCFSRDVFFIFCQREISEMREPTGLKICMMVSTSLSFIIKDPTFWEAHPKKISGAKNVQNLTRFRTTSKFGGKCLQNGWRYSKSDSHFIYRDSSRVRQNKPGEVRSSDLEDLDVKSYPPKGHFSEKHILAPMGCCAPKFLHALENNQVLLAHPYRGRGPPYNFFQRGVKNWHKM